MPCMLCDGTARRRIIVRHPRACAAGIGGGAQQSLRRARQRAVVSVIALALSSPAAAVPFEGPVQRLPPAGVPVPIDRAFAGTIALSVDATDVAHKLYTVEVVIPVQAAGAMTLLYPRWEAASHGPSLSVVNLTGLTIFAGARRLAWRRDPLEPHAFHFDVPAGAASVTARYQVVAAAGALTRDLIVLPWQQLILYPAGWYARNIAVAATVSLPGELTSHAPLIAGRSAGGRLVLPEQTLEALLDSPVYAAQLATRISLTAGDAPVTLTAMAAAATPLVIPPERVDALRRMVAQTRRVFGAAPFARYDFLVRLGNDLSTGGTEHRAAGGITLPAGYFDDWSHQLLDRDIFPHELVHAWNGLYRTPADLWAPTPNVPQSGSLLWVYEGQTEFWGRVLAARAGLRSTQETLERLALDAAEVSQRPGRAWRPLADDVTYPAFMLRQPVRWRDWQRRRDYYDEGVLLWLAVEARLRERSGGRRGLDDFAHAFFAGATPDAPTRTYTFEALCAALEAVAPGDWSGFLTTWLEAHDELDPSAGLRALGWVLVFSDTPTETFRQHEAELGGVDLSYSLGIVVTAEGRIGAVSWQRSAFTAGLSPGGKIMTVGSQPFSIERLLDAVRRSEMVPIRLTVEQDGRQGDYRLRYRGPLRYPRLERSGEYPDRLTALLAPR
jgi:predicted metalloprotease with PDZ domain